MPGYDVRITGLLFVHIYQLRAETVCLQGDQHALQHVGLLDADPDTPLQGGMDASQGAAQ